VGLGIESGRRFGGRNVGNTGNDLISIDQLEQCLSGGLVRRRGYPSTAQVGAGVQEKKDWGRELRILWLV